MVAEFNIGTPREWVSTSTLDESLFNSNWFPTKNGFIYAVYPPFCEHASYYLDHSLFDAALTGNTSLIAEMVKRVVGTDYKLFEVSTRPQGLTLMHYAVAGNQAGMVSFLLRKMARPHTPDINGTSPFALAARYGFSNILKILIAGGALVPGVDRLGNTCLHEAAGMAQNNALKFLLDLISSERNAVLVSYVLWLKNVLGFTCYDHAVNRGYTDTAELILSYMRKDCVSCDPIFPSF